MTEAEVLAKLEELLKLPNELEWLEFKTASSDFDFDKLGEYFSALSNESNLHHQAAGGSCSGLTRSTTWLGPTGRKIPARWRR
jgi:ATP-dependent DNA helicase RecG